jgi:hypothetical protein
MSYHLQLSVDKNRKSPKLVIGDSVFINFHPGDELASINAWKGRITEAIDATSRGQLNVIVDRPRQKDTFLPLDDEEYSILTVEGLANMKHSSILRTWSRDNSKKSVAIFTKNGEEECKRLMNSITKLKVSRNLRDTYPAKAAALKAQTELLLMKNFTQLKSSGLFKDVDAGQWGQARQILVSYLRDYQLDAFTEMEDNGLYENIARVTGPSGSGKSYLAFVIAVAYTLDINVPDSQIERNAREKAAMFQSFDEHRFKQAAKSAAEAGGIEGEPETKRASSKDDRAPPKPEEDNPETYTKQPGRVTFCGIQNDTVDEVYRVLRLVTSRFMISMEMPPKLVLRLHSSSSEIDAVVAMSRPSYNPLQKKLPLNYDPNTKMTDSLPRSLLDAYLTHYCYTGLGYTSLGSVRTKAR